jgi:hypothetical protein
VNGDIEAILAQIPKDQGITQAVWEHLDKEIRTGGDINALQREIIWTIVNACLGKNVTPTPPTVAFFAFAYQELMAEAKLNEDAKKRLGELVRTLKAQPAIASSVAQVAQQMTKERERRRDELARSVARMMARETQAGRASEQAKHDPANTYIAKMQGARHGHGDNAMPNLDLAAQIADEAVDLYPTHPKVLFEAAGCHHLLAHKGKHLSLTARYVHLKQAATLYQQCLERLAGPPYGNLKGDYDQWRKGLSDLLPKLQEELVTLQERQERQR